MFKMLCFACALATSAVVVTGQAMPPPSTQRQINAAETAIRSARAELNAALTNRDLKTTARYWLPDVNTIGGDGSLWAGRDENTKGFAKIFRDPNFVSGLRTPGKVQVATGGVTEAAETGVWEWRERVASQVLTYSGPYLVMWQLVDGKWRIRSELYVTTDCTAREYGSECGSTSRVRTGHAKRAL